MRETWYDLEAQGILSETDAWEKYEKLGSLGEGTFGDVVLCVPRGGGRKVAIKSLRTVNLEDPRCLSPDPNPNPNPNGRTHDSSPPTRKCTT